MKVAAVYDIHGNLPALEAVLEEIDALEVNQIVVGGDVVLGPMSRECLDRLLSCKIPIQFIKGNCEIAVLEEMDKGYQGSLPQSVVEDIRWTARQLLPRHQKEMLNWPMTVTFRMNGLGKILFCHATPENENENFTKLTPEEKLLPIFSDVNAEVVVCGHTHMQFDRRIGTKRVINAGSVGMPFGKPGAYWLLIDSDINFRHVVYNARQAVTRVRNTTYPHAEQFAEGSILNPPSEESMLKLFSNAQ